MTRLQGYITEVTDAPRGVTLSAAAIIGATAVFVEDRWNLPETGTLETGTQSITYTLDETDETKVLLNTALTAAATDGDWWTLSTGAVERVAMVAMNDNDQDSMEALLPWGFADLLDTGTQDDPPLAVIEDWNPGEWVVVDVNLPAGTTPRGRIIDVSGVPLTDGDAPAVSPTPLIRGGIGILFITWTPITNNDPVTYDVHLSPTSGFTPGPLTLVGSVQGSMFTARALTDGTILGYETDYFAKTVARDPDGSGPASAESAAGQMVQVNSPDIAVNAIIAQHILAEQIHAEALAGEIILGSTIRTSPSGEGIVLDTAGFRAIDPAGNEKANIPTVGDPVFRATLYALGLDVIGNATFRGVENVMDAGSSLILRSRIADPAAAPSLSQQVPESGALVSGGSFVEGSYPWFDGTNVWLSTQYQIAPTWSKLDAACTTVVASGSLSLPGVVGNWFDIHIVKVGSYWYGSARRSSDGDRRLLVWDATGPGGGPGTRTADGGYFQDEEDSGQSGAVSMTTDGTKLYFFQEAAASNFGIVKVYTPPGTGAVPTYDGAGSNVTIAQEFWNRVGMTGVVIPFIRSNADFGAARYIFRAQTPLSGYLFWVTDTAGAQMSNEHFPSAEAGLSRGFWYASGFKELMSSVAKRWEYTSWVWTTSDSAVYWIRYAWYNGTQRTARSPSSSITLLKRRQLTIVVPDLPVSQVSLYMDRGAAEPTLDHQVDSASKTNVRTGFTAGGAAPPTTSNMPGATDAQLKSQGGEPLLRANGFSRCRLRYTAGAAVLDSVLRFIRFGTEDVDTDGYHPTTTDATTTAPDSTYDITLPFIGQYLVIVNFTWVENGGGTRRIQINIDGVLDTRQTQPGHAGEANRPVLTTIVDTNAVNQKLTVGFFQNAGSSTTLSNAKLSIVYLGPA